MSLSYDRQQLSRNCCRMAILALLLCCLGGVSQAQYTHTLLNTMSSPQGGSAVVAVAAFDDHTFMLSEGGGLWALQQTDPGFHTNAYRQIPDRPHMIAVGNDGMIYLANDAGALSAWTLTGSTFLEIARIACPHPIHDVMVSDDGTVFVAAGMEGFAAYRYDGGTLVETGRANEGGDIRTVAVGRDGFVYVASRLETYVAVHSYDGTAFHRLARHDGCPRMATALAVTDDGLVLLADLVEGLSTYRFDGTNLVSIAHAPEAGAANDVTVLPTGQVSVACGPEGMRVYQISGDDLLPWAHWSGVRNDARGVAAGMHARVLLANGADGLRAFDCSGAEPRCIAHQPAGHEALGVAVGWDGTIFVANGADGLVAYGPGEPMLHVHAQLNGGGGMPGFARAVAVDGANRVYVAHDDALSVYWYTAGAFKYIARIPAIGPATGIALDRWGRIYLACGERGLQVFQLMGSDLRPYARLNDGGLVKDVAVTRTGTVFLAGGMDGLRACVWAGLDLRCIAHINDGVGPPDGAVRIALAPDNTVFLAAGREGLRAYSFNGAFFTPTAWLRLPLGGETAGVSALDIGADGTIFFGCNDLPGSESDGLFACRYDGAGLRITARSEHADFASDVAVAPDGMVFLADRHGGTLGYTYLFGGTDAPALAVNPLTVDFGALSVGTTARRYVTLSNTGTAMLHITGLQLITANIGEFSIVNPWPTELPAGTSMRVCVQCTPRTTGIKGATFRIVSDDPERPFFDIPLTASVGYTAPSVWQLPTITLGQNIPNPFNPSTEISYYLPQPEHVRIAVFDLAGRRIAVLVDAMTPAGWHSVRFDGSNHPSGMYMYRLEAGASTVARKMVLLN